MSTDSEKLMDVVAVDMKTNKIRLISTNKTEKNAEAVWKMAVMRRGTETEFFAAIDAGKYKEGDTWEGK